MCAVCKRWIAIDSWNSVIEVVLGWNHQSEKLQQNTDYRKNLTAMMIKTRLVFPPSDLRRPREQLLKSIVGGINALGDSNRPVLKAIIDEQAAAVSNSRPNEKPYAPLELWKLAIAMGTMMCTLCELGEVCLRQEDEDEGGTQVS